MVDNWESEEVDTAQACIGSSHYAGQVELMVARTYILQRNLLDQEVNSD